VAIHIQPLVDAGGVKKLRLVIDLNSAYMPDETSDVVRKARKTELAMKFADLKLSNALMRSYELDGALADRIRVEEQDGDTWLYVNTRNKIDAEKCSVTPLMRQGSLPWRLCIDIVIAPADVIRISRDLARKIIVIDPGHGGSDTGAIGPTGLQEKTPNLQIAKLLKNYLINAGARVVMTRETNVDVGYPNDSDVEELSARVRVAEQEHADLFLSIHNDAYFNPSCNGTATYYTPKTAADARFAACIQNNLVDSINLVDKGIRKANFYVLRNSSMTSALVEVAFISNINEENLLRQSDFQDKAAEGIFHGIVEYIQKYGR
jgi:N-acetylmuramoyl-L-alanine amidase